MEGRLKKLLIHEVMIMAYEEGIEEGKRQAVDAMKQVGDVEHDRKGIPNTIPAFDGEEGKD